MVEQSGAKDERPSLDTREITDPRELRALTHPVRLALLEVLAVKGALTATQAGELIGESPTTCSFHFRQLAKYGFVEEAGGGSGRNRPWRRVHIGMSFPDTFKDPETAIAAEALAGLFYSRMFDRFEHWRRIRHSYPEVWQEASGVTESVMYVTPEELRELGARLHELLVRYNDRLVDPGLRPADALAVEVIAAAYPVLLESGGAGTVEKRRNRDAGGALMRRLLRHSNARRYLIGQCFSLFGDTAMFLAMGIWVKVLSGSNGEAGLVFFSFSAAALLSPVAGMIVDRLPRRPLLIWSNLGGAAVVLLLVLVHGKGQLWLIFLVAFLYGLAYTFLSAGQSALLKVMLPDDLIGDARGMLSTVREGLRLFGPLTGAGLFALAGGGVVAMIDAASFVIAATSLLFVKVEEEKAEREEVHFVAEVTAGITHIWRTLVLRQMVIAGGITLLVVGFSESICSRSSARACTARRLFSAC